MPEDIIFYEHGEAHALLALRTNDTATNVVKN